MENVNIVIEKKLTATVYINGEKKEATVQNGENVGALALRLASQYNIRTFNVTVDNTALSPEAAAATPVTEDKPIAITAKDARGTHEGHVEGDGCETLPIEAPTPATPEEQEELREVLEELKEEMGEADEDAREGGDLPDGFSNDPIEGEKAA